MGSTGLFLTPAEAAEVLGVSVQMVHVYDRRQLLEAHYPGGALRGKKFLAEDVYALAELRTQYKGDFLRKLPQIALRAAVTSRRVEKRLEELMSFLGLNDVVLSLEPQDVIDLHHKVEVALSQPRVEDEADVIAWSKKFLAINEEYLELVKTHVGEAFPWKPYLELARLVAGRANGRSQSYIAHARASLRNVAYFYERAFRGPAEANAMFPGERYSGKLLQRLMMT